MGRAVKIALLVWFGALLSAPLVLYVAGQRPGDMENRTLAAQPDLSLRALADIETYRQGAVAFSDRLPFRDRVIRNRNRLTYELLGDSPVPQVLVGKDRWLFLRDDLLSCAETGTPEAAAMGLDVLRAGLAMTGRELRILVVPSKTWIEREHYGRVLSQDACARDRESRFEAAVQPIPGFLDLGAEMRAAKASGEDVFYSHDSHAGPLASIAATRLLVESIDPAAWASGSFTVGPPAPKPGDLVLLMGLDFLRDSPTLAVVPATQPVTVPTFAVGDSQLLNNDIIGLAPFFTDLTTCIYEAHLALGCDPAAVKRAKVIVVESVGRFALGRSAATAAPFFELLQDELPGTPVAWDAPEGATIDATGQAVAPAQARLHVGGAVADDPSHYRLLRFAVAAAGVGQPAVLTRRDGTLLDAPLVSIVLATGRNAFVLVPPGVPVADTVLQVLGAAPSTLGPPTLVDLGPPAGG